MDKRDVIQSKKKKKKTYNTNSKKKGQKIQATKKKGELRGESFSFMLFRNAGREMDKELSVVRAAGVIQRVGPEPVSQHHPLSISIVFVVLAC